MDTQKTTPARAGHLHFVVTGSFLTTHARERVLDLGWTNALRFLTESLDCMTSDQAMEVLSGRRRLGGSISEGVSFEAEAEDTTAEVLDDQRYHFAGMVQHAGFWWRPYAVIGQLGPDDAYASGRVASRWYAPVESSPALAGEAARTAFTKARAVHYMRDPVNDRAEFVTVEGRQRIVFFERAAEGPPPWWPPAASWQAAVDTNVRRLEERGWDHEYESKTAAEWLKRRGGRLGEIGWGEAEEVEEGDPASTASNHIRRLAEEMGVSPDAADGLAAHLTGESTFHPHPVEPQDIGLHGYISPNGTCWRCKYHGHRDLASHLFPEAEDAERAADDAGYLRIQTSAFGLDAEHKGRIVGAPTAAQRGAWMLWRAAAGKPEWGMQVL